MADQDKIYPASQKKIQQAREQGNVPRSRELGIFLILLFGFSSFLMVSTWMVNQSINIFQRGLKLDIFTMTNPELLPSKLMGLMIDGLILIAPVLFILLISCFLSPILLRSFIFSTQALVPNLARLNPIEGLKRLVSLQAFVELGKAILKTILLGAIGLGILWGVKEEILNLTSEDLFGAINHSGKIIIISIITIVSSLIVIVMIDVPFQLWSYYDKLKMSLEEFKKEMKEMGGNPQIRARQRAVASQATRKKMMQEVPNADVIITNPTHYAVALSYKDGMSAPKVVAMGADNLAKKIRTIAKENKIKIIEAPPLARALYKFTEVDQEIPHAFYQAVAEVLGYVHQLNNWDRVGGVYPTPPESFFSNDFNV